MVSAELLQVWHQQRVRAQREEQQKRTHALLEAARERLRQSRAALRAI